MRIIRRLGFPHMIKIGMKQQFFALLAQLATDM